MVFCIWHEDFYLISRLYSSTFSKIKLKNTISIFVDCFNTLVTSYIITVITLLSSYNRIFITNLDHDLLICRVSSSVDNKRFAFMSYITIVICLFIDSPTVCIWVSPARYHWVVKLSCSFTAISTCKSIFKLTLIYNIVNSCDVDALNHGVLIVLWNFNFFNSIFLEVMRSNN